MMTPFKAVSCLFTAKIISPESTDQLIQSIKSRLKESLDLDEISPYIPLNNNGRMIILGIKDDKSTNKTLTGTLRVYPDEQIITVNLEGASPVNTSSVENSYDFCTGSDLKAINNNSMDRLKTLLSQDLGQEVEKVPVIKRLSQVPIYFSSSDDRMFEYDFEETVFDQQSQHQRVAIYKSRTFGNCLFLDDLQNLAESDINYTHGIMNYGKNSYKDKEILILGGGDGALLHELVKEDPKFVTMVDIDQVVMDACKKYLRNACGSTLDTFKTDKYHVIVGDCIQYLEGYIKEGRKFDYVFNDLTDIPLSPEHTDVGKDLWGFVRKVLNLSLQVLNPTTGIYLNHVS